MNPWHCFLMAAACFAGAQIFSRGRTFRQGSPGSNGPREDGMRCCSYVDGGAGRRMTSPVRASAGCSGRRALSFSRLLGLGHTVRRML